MPDQSGGDFNIKLREFVLNFDIDLVESTLSEIVDDSDVVLSVRFCAYYGLATYYRRNMYSSKFNCLVERYRQLFNCFGLNDVLLSLYYKNISLEYGGGGYDKCIDYAFRALKKFPNNSAVMHHVAAMVGESVENNIITSPSYIDKALECLEDAMEHNNGYPKHYYTKSLLQLYRNDHDGALVSVRKAKDLEKKMRLVQISG